MIGNPKTVLSAMAEETDDDAYHSFTF